MVYATNDTRVFCELLDFIYESEDEHNYHMYQKKKNAEYMGMSIDDMPNKKYGKDKSESDKRKADLRYAYKEGQFERNKRFTEMSGPNTMAARYGNNLHDYDDKQIRAFMNEESEKKCKDLLRKLRYFSDNAADGLDPNADKKYEIAFRIFSKRFGIKDGSSVTIKFDDKDSYTNTDEIKKAAIAAGISVGSTVGASVVRMKIKSKYKSIMKDINKYTEAINKNPNNPKNSIFRAKLKKANEDLKKIEKAMKIANIALFTTSVGTGITSSKLASSVSKKRDKNTDNAYDRAKNKLSERKDQKYNEKYGIDPDKEDPKDKKRFGGKYGDTMISITENHGKNKVQLRSKSEAEKEAKPGEKIRPGMSLYHATPVADLDYLRASAHSENYTRGKVTKEQEAEINQLKSDIKEARKSYNEAKKNGDKSGMKAQQKKLNDINKKLRSLENYSGQYHSKRRVYVTFGKDSEDSQTHSSHGVGLNVYRVTDAPDNLYIDPEANYTSKVDSTIAARKMKPGKMSGVPAYIEVEGKKGIPVERSDKKLVGNPIPTIASNPKYLVTSTRINKRKTEKKPGT